jgi:hypothetical protein
MLKVQIPIILYAPQFRAQAQIQMLFEIFLAPFEFQEPLCSCHVLSSLALLGELQVLDAFSHPISSLLTASMAHCISSLSQD